MFTINFRSIRQYLFFGLFILAPFSKIPYIPLPILEFTSFRFGLYQIFSLVFLAVSMPSLARNGRKLFADRKLQIIIGLLAVCMLVGSISAIDLGRNALLSASFIFLVLNMICAMDFVATHKKKQDVNKYIKAMLYAGIFYGFVSLVHLLIVTFGDTGFLLCKGCLDTAFGFPRINVFAAEPLFWANALLPFFVIALYSLYHKYSRLALLALFGVTMAIGLTFTRGAYIAVGFMCLVLFVITVRRKQINFGGSRNAILAVGIGFILSWTLLIGSAVHIYSGAPYIAYNTFRGMVEHVTLGVITLPEKHETVVVVSNKEDSGSKDNFVSGGLVEASQNERTESAKLAFKALKYDVRTLLFGVGLGNLGPFVTDNIYGGAASNLTVYIFYVLFVSEMGLVGLGAFLALFGLALYRLVKQKEDIATITALILIGFLVQYMFFGSYINVIYIWLWLGVGLGVGIQASKHKVEK